MLLLSAGLKSRLAPPTTSTADRPNSAAAGAV
jgi:hypothetical protein